MKGPPINLHFPLLVGRGYPQYISNTSSKHDYSSATTALPENPWKKALLLAYDLKLRCPLGRHNPKKTCWLRKPNMKKNETSTFRDKGCFFSLPSFFQQLSKKRHWMFSVRPIHNQPSNHQISSASRVLRFSRRHMNDAMQVRGRGGGLYIR